MLEWIRLGLEGSDNDVAVAFALGYMFRIIARTDRLGYNTEIYSINGKEGIGFATRRENAEIQANTWLQLKARDYVRLGQ